MGKTHSTQRMYLRLDNVARVLCSLLITTSWNCQKKSGKHTKAVAGLQKALYMLKKDENWELA